MIEQIRSDSWVLIIPHLHGRSRIGKSALGNDAPHVQIEHLYGYEEAGAIRQARLAVRRLRRKGYVCADWELINVSQLAYSKDVNQARVAGGA